jgi:hypothetical protein
MLESLDESSTTSSKDRFQWKIRARIIEDYPHLTEKEVAAL